MPRRSLLYERAFSKSSRVERQRLARDLKNNRQKVNEGKAFQKRGIGEYEACLGFPPNGIIQRIKLAIQKRKRPLSVLDIGNGKGLFLSALKMLFKENVVTTGLSTARTSRGDGIDHVRTGSIERFGEREQYDFIFSIYTFMYATSPKVGLHNVINALRTGGEAFIELDGTGLQLKRLPMELHHEYPNFHFRLRKKMFSRTYLHMVRRR
mgnify:CR=1 FL=1